MTTARSNSYPDPVIGFADARAAEKAALLERNALAAKTVAVHARSAAECTELLAMLGLDLADLK
ncbi:hypothetical protein IU501_10035 [Nocardia otitidiscaviarum]|uniref:Uncharacterized protein n=1 Tax=Nocardia otitidiscaviarum TaxID=1823 RepID=A0A378YMC6_9NOCA|nr:MULTISPECIES: hypothetical protein [Nocardia]MBF6133337.1 hypothetical protein [Nocardia otitidiscaviarum]MBF6181657.1 hypothetical protein [Nocardia otitidiscaviarum]MBF6240582.1 hypothetical protein [Nocardia otitidiscaviarum]MBF6486733.1 hypothetical protein [Nocardia otitidiscaviarum]MCP9618917.1 hypothetical protein [Nocardia otitidiscaviarum]